MKRRPRLRTATTRIRRGRRRSTRAEARARYERAAEALAEMTRALLETVAKVGSLAYMDPELWHRCWTAFDRFEAARVRLWTAEHGPGDRMGWSGDVMEWRP